MQWIPKVISKYRLWVFWKKNSKKTGLGASVNKELAEELHKPVIKKIKRKRVYARLKGNIWAADLAEIWSLLYLNHDLKLLCMIDVFTNYAWVKPLKDKKSKTVLNGFIKIVNKSNQNSVGLIKEQNITIAPYAKLARR